jgi:hypothetical protein
MVIYHLGFPAQSYLAAKVYPEARVIDCQPLTDTPEQMLAGVGDETEVLFHIDLSVQERVPLRRVEIVGVIREKEIRLHNSAHTDQRKRCLQEVSRAVGFGSLSASQEGEADELLVVKSDINVGGGPERRTLRRFPRLPVPQLPSRVTNPSEYHVLPRREVPTEIWEDATLQVERYVANEQGLVVRSFWNQGKGVVSVIENPREIIKKRNERCPRWNYEEPVDELTATVFTRMKVYAEKIGVSFFAADWVVDEAKNPHLVDLNLTPQWVLNPAGHTENQRSGLHIFDIPSRLQTSCERRPAAGMLIAPRTDL